MVSSATMAEMTVNIQSHQLQREPEMGQASYGAAVIGLYVLGMICSFAFLVNGAGLKTAVSASFIFFLSCAGGVIFLWWQDNKLCRKMLADQMQPENFRVTSDGEEHKPLDATLS